MVRGPVSMVIVGVISLIMVALTMGGPKVFENVLPDSAMAWLDGVGMGEMGMEMPSFGGGSDTSASSDDPQRHLRTGHDGWNPSNKIAAMPYNTAVFIADVITGRRTSIKGHSPAAVTVLTPMEGCSFTPPSEGAFVGHVSALWKSGLTLGLATYGDADLAAAVRGMGIAYRTTGSRMFSNTNATLLANSFDSYDVVVTQTEKPVYLVLQSSSDLRMWNIHLAPGARIERVALLGGLQTGVINLPADVPVEVLRAAEVEACGLPNPFYPLNPGALIYQSMESGALPADEAQVTLDKIAEQGRVYDAWFRAQFGVSADETMAGNWKDGSIAVAGPVPATPEGRAEWRSIKEGTAQVTVDAYIEYEGLAEEGADFVSRVEAIATAFAWGDLKNLKQGVDF